MAQTPPLCTSFPVTQKQYVLIPHNSGISHVVESEHQPDGGPGEMTWAAVPKTQRDLTNRRLLN